MKRIAAAVLLAVVLLPGVALAGSSSDAALALGAFAVFNQMLGGVGIFGAPARAVVVAPAPPVVYAPPPAVVYAPPPPVVYAPQPVYVVPAPPVYVAPRPVVIYRSGPAFRRSHWDGHGRGEHRR